MCADSLESDLSLSKLWKRVYNVYRTIAMVVVFGFESLTEWAYHPCISPGFSFILMQVVLMRDCRDKAASQRAKEPQKQRAGRQE